jgi:hypothetical protein
VKGSQPQAPPKEKATWQQPKPAFKVVIATLSKIETKDKPIESKLTWTQRLAIVNDKVGCQAHASLSPYFN